MDVYYCRLRKSSSPSRPWLMGNTGHGVHSSSRRPPTSPQVRNHLLARHPMHPSPAVRRGSAAPPIRKSPTRQLSMRSRSLDGLLDDKTPSSEDGTEQQLLRECEQYLSAQVLDSKKEEKEEKQESALVNKTQSCDVNLDSDTASTISSGEPRSGISQGSLLSLPLPSSGEPKRKRNFMDRCVNKVRSLMRK